MIIKRGDAQILEVIKDDEHKIDDNGTRKAIDNVKPVEIKKDQVVPQEPKAN